MRKFDLELSDCCGAPPRGETDNANFGFCGQCGEGAHFTVEEVYDRCSVCKSDLYKDDVAIEDYGIVLGYCCLNDPEANRALNKMAKRDPTNWN